MSNKVFLNQQGFIEVHSIGDQTPDVVTSTKQELAVLAKTLSARGKTVNILTDLRRIGKQTGASRALAKDIMDTIPFRKIAIFGANRFLKYVVNFIITGSGHGHHVRYFNDHQSAETWLKT